MPIVNPFEEDPDGYLEHHGPLVVPCVGNDRAHITHRGLRLFRSELVVYKSEFLERFMKAVELWARTPPGSLREVFRGGVIEHIRPQAEYSACAASFLRRHLGDEAATFLQPAGGGADPEQGRGGLAAAREM